MKRGETKMATRKLTDLAIQVRVVPRRPTWPAAHSSATWTFAHHCVDALHALVRSVDIAVAEAEQGKALAMDVIQRHRRGIADAAIAKLSNFAQWKVSEKALREKIESLESHDRTSEQVRLLQQLKQALAELEYGLGAAERAIEEICRVRQGVPV
jgi:predicted MarR family transcription regulator